MLAQSMLNVPGIMRGIEISLATCQAWALEGTLNSTDKRANHLPVCCAQAKLMNSLPRLRMTDLALVSVQTNII